MLAFEIENRLNEAKLRVELAMAEKYELQLAKLKRESRFAIDVADELARAREKHRTPIHSAHEGYAVLLEELDEVKAEVFHGDRTKLRAELVQVAAMAQRMAEDLSL